MSSPVIRRMFGGTSDQGGGGGGAPFVASYTEFERDTPDRIVTETDFMGSNDAVFTLSFIVGKFESIAANQTFLDIAASNHFRARARQPVADWNFAFKATDSAGTVMLNTYNTGVALVIDTLYHVHIAADFTSATTDFTFKVNNIETIFDQDPRALGSGGFHLSGTGSFFGSTQTTTQSIDGCYGPIYLMKGIYEPDATKFVLDATGGDFRPNDWTTGVVAALGTPELLIPDWLDTVPGTSSNGAVVNAGSGGNLDRTFGFDDVIIGTPTACAM